MIIEGERELHLEIAKTFRGLIPVKRVSGRLN